MAHVILLGTAIVAEVVWGINLWRRFKSDWEFDELRQRVPRQRAARIIQAAHKSMRFRRLWRARERPDPTSIMGSTTAWDHAATRTRRNYYNDAGHWSWIYRNRTFGNVPLTMQ